ncbi:antibiotic biosynthesis monooxygenase [Emcibacter sp. SYSU 3D8]|uniref:putative quinol monooxygenase n=1 Tax=Emcibacter sp. SYSU 3D8 TaxID=3133969 RepID=UPI0031FEC305
MLIATGRLETDPSLVHDLLADLRAGIDRTLQEDGCHFYSFALEDAAAGTIITLQIWRDEEALAAHLCAPELGELVARWTDRFKVHTKLYDAENERPVGDWHNPDLARMIAESRT